MLERGWIAVCWCGWATDPCVTVDDASAHATRHEQTHEGNQGMHVALTIEGERRARLDHVTGMRACTVCGRIDAHEHTGAYADGGERLDGDAVAEVEGHDDIA